MYAVNAHVRENSLASHRATPDVKRIDHTWAAVAVSNLEIVSDHEQRFVVWREAYSVGVGYLLLRHHNFKGSTGIPSIYVGGKSALDCYNRRGRANMSVK
jgi:hypothetical protein